MKHRFSKNLKFDWLLFLSCLLVPTCGLIILYSAGFNPSLNKPLYPWLPVVKSIPFLKQSFFTILGCVVMLISMKIPTKFFYNFSYYIYTTGVLLLIAVDLVGTISKGSQRWLSIGSLNIQPAEFMKIGVIFTLSKYLSTHLPKKGVYTIKELVIPFLIFAVPMVLILKQPDLGTALSVGAIGASLILFIGINIRTIILIIVLISSLSPIFWSHLHDYQRDRIISLFNPDLDPKGSGYHINQSKIAVGSGELYGKGFLNGSQTQLEFLPEHTTDFIFSVLAEEWGFIGCILVLCLYMFFLFNLLKVSAFTKDIFSSFLVIGIASNIFFHSFVNIGMVIGILPVVGIPLPLFSYGGSATLSSMFNVGIVLGVSYRRHKFLNNF